MTTKIGVFFLILMLFNNTVHAGHWIDDWVNQRTSTGPDYFETQKRGYASFGSASARWRTGSDYLMTITKPKFEAGCGGVDAFLGGFGFLQFDQLVDRFQQSMGPAAAAFAFDIALGVLSKQASTSVKSLSAIIDRLNQLQLDDCKASKAAVVTIADGLDSKRFAQQKSEAVSDFLQSSGIQDLRKNITDLGAGTTAQTALSNAGGGAVSQLVAGCPQNLKDIFFSEGWVLNHLGAKKGLSGNYTALMRGMVGDIYVSAAAVDFVSVAPCPENAGKTIGNFINGDTYIRPGVTQSCTKIVSLNIGGKSYSSVRDWVFQSLQSIGTKIIQRNTDFTASEQALLQTVPAPIYKAISTRVVQLSSSTAVVQVANEFADYVATIQVYNMLSDFYATMDSTIRLAQTTYETQMGTTTGSNQHTCKIELAEGAVKSLDDKRNDMALILQRTHNEYRDKLADLNITLELGETLRKQEDTFEAESARSLGAQAKRMAK